MKQRNEIYSWLQPFVGLCPEGDTFREICRAVSAVCRQKPDLPAIFESVRSLPNTPLTARAVWQFAWRIAGNQAKIARGIPVRPWTGQLEPEWMPFEILEVVSTRTNFGAGHELTLRAMAGSYAGETTVKFFGGGSFWWQTRALGFTSRGAKALPYHDQAQLVQLRMVGLVLPELTRDRPAFREFTIPGPELAWNKRILKQRIFRDPPCPFNFKHACHLCPVGYRTGAVTCPAACRPVTLTARHCPTCNQETWCDSDDPRVPCVACSKRRPSRRNLG